MLTLSIARRDISRDANKKHRWINRGVWLTRVRLWGLLRDFHSSVFETSDSTGTINSVIKANRVSLDAQTLQPQHWSSQTITCLRQPKHLNPTYMFAMPVPTGSVASGLPLFPKSFLPLLLYTVCVRYTTCEQFSPSGKLAFLLCSKKLWVP